METIAIMAILIVQSAGDHFIIYDKNNSTNAMRIWFYRVSMVSINLDVLQLENTHEVSYA